MDFAIFFSYVKLFIRLIKLSLRVIESNKLIFIYTYNVIYISISICCLEEILELINGEYLDSTDKSIDVSQGADSDWMYWLHLNDNNGIIELFNDDLLTTTSQSKPYRK